MVLFLPLVAMRVLAASLIRLFRLLGMGVSRRRWIALRLGVIRCVVCRRDERVWEMAGGSRRVTGWSQGCSAKMGDRSAVGWYQMLGLQAR